MQGKNEGEGENVFFKKDHEFSNKSEKEAPTTGPPFSGTYLRRGPAGATAAAATVGQDRLDTPAPW